MWSDPFSERANKEGCASCGMKTTSCYVVDFGFFPRKLVRKHHRTQHQTVLFCRPCYEAASELPIVVGGTAVNVGKKGISIAQGVPCLPCGQLFLPGQALYGFLQCSLWMSGSCVESLPLACFCSKCAEKLTIGLVAKI
jgi:hypothetical protein